jgi:hypothetical protein
MVMRYVQNQSKIACSIYIYVYIYIVESILMIHDIQVKALTIKQILQRAVKSNGNMLPLTLIYIQVDSKVFHH